METKKSSTAPYMAPACEMFELNAETVLCQSGVYDPQDLTEGESGWFEN